MKLGGDTCHETEETRGHNAFMAQSRRYVKNTTVADDEQSTSSDVESEDELSERDDISRRLRTSRSTEGKAMEINSAQPQETQGSSDKATSETTDGDNVLRTSPRFHLGSTSASNARGVGPNKFFNGGRCNRKPLRSGATGRFISPTTEGKTETAITPRSVTTGRFVARNDGSDRQETTPFQHNLDSTVHAVGTSGSQIYCGVCRGYVDHRWHPRCHSTVEQGTPVTVELSDDSDQEQKLDTVVEVVRVMNNLMKPIPHAYTDDSDGTESEDEKEIVSFCGQYNA